LQALLLVQCSLLLAELVLGFQIRGIVLEAGSQSLLLQSLLVLKSSLVLESLVEALVLESSLVLQSLVESETLLLNRSLNDLVRMLGRQDDALLTEFLDLLDLNNGNLLVNHLLHLIDDVRVNNLVHDGCSGNCCRSKRSRRLVDVLLDVVNHRLLDVPGDNGLHLNQGVRADNLFHNGGLVDGFLDDLLGHHVSNSRICGQRSRK